VGDVLAELLLLPGALITDEVHGIRPDFQHAFVLFEFDAAVSGRWTRRPGQYGQAKRKQKHPEPWSSHGH
jgi:hypothetical protein